MLNLSLIYVAVKLPEFEGIRMAFMEHSKGRNRDFFTEFFWKQLIEMTRIKDLKKC